MKSPSDKPATKDHPHPGITRLRSVVYARFLELTPNWDW